MRKALAILALALVGCSEPRFPDRAECKDLAIGLATAEVNAFCPVSAGSWEECPHAERIERDLEIALRLCDAR